MELTNHLYQVKCVVDEYSFFRFFFFFFNTDVYMGEDMHTFELPLCACNF